MQVHDRILLPRRIRVFPPLVAIFRVHPLLLQHAAFRTVFEVVRPRERARVAGQGVVRRDVQRIIDVLDGDGLAVAPGRALKQRQLDDHVVGVVLRIVLFDLVVVVLPVFVDEGGTAQVGVAPLLREAGFVFARLLVQRKQGVVDQAGDRRGNAVARLPREKGRREGVRRDLADVERRTRILPPLRDGSAASRSQQRGQKQGAAQREYGRFAYQILHSLPFLDCSIGRGAGARRRAPPRRVVALAAEGLRLPCRHSLGIGYSSGTPKPSFVALLS